MHIYRAVSHLYPNSLRRKIAKTISYANLKIDSNKFIGFITVISFLLGALAGFLIGFFINKPFWMIFFPSVVLINAVVS